jgi:hypothetical protein
LTLAVPTASCAGAPLLIADSEKASSWPWALSVTPRLFVWPRLTHVPVRLLGCKHPLLALVVGFPKSPRLFHLRLWMENRAKGVRMTASLRYVIHPTYYERDKYILNTLLADEPEGLPLTLLRQTDWRICEIALDELGGVSRTPATATEKATVQRIADALRQGEAIEPVLVLGPEKRLLAGHHRVQALAALGEKHVLAYHGELM